MALAFSGRFAADDLIFGTDLRDLEIAVQDGQATLYAVTGMNGGISRWQLNGSGAPQLAGQQLHAQADLRTGGFELAEAGGGLRLLQAQTSQSSLAFYQLQNDGSLGSRQQDALAGAEAGGFGAVAVLELAGGKTAFYGAGSASGTLQGWQLDAGGAVQGRTAAAGGAGAYSLEGPAQLAAVQSSAGPVLLAADAAGLRSYRADAATGALSLGGMLGTAQGLAVSDITALEGFEAGGKAWALLGAAGNSSLTLVQVTGTGGLKFTAQLQDTALTRFGGISALEVVEADGHLLVLAAGNDGGMSLFTLTPGGRLIHLQSLEHETGLGLQNVTALEAAVAGGQLQVFAASGAESGISRFTLPLSGLGELRQGGSSAARLEGSSAGDVLEGGTGRDTLEGHAGDDVLVAGAGGGRLTGGAGADIFVIDPAAGSVTVTDFSAGTDRLDLSLFEGLYAAGQLQAVQTSQGLQLTAGSTRILLQSGSGGGLELEDVFGPALRFAFPESRGLGETLPGGTFVGSEGNDLMQGGGTGDTLLGEGGQDRLKGEGGSDWLEGGGGRDTLAGHSGYDTLRGGDGNDLLRGGQQGDRLQGNAGADRLYGEDGQDWLWGGWGADRLYGGSSNDQLWGEGGNDRIYGEGGNDLLRGGEGNDLLA
ncbi:calcium-binding protein, partial [Leisingera sp. ANG-Vp]|uniref:calcium-binding protein n=1 Tax=Leisingera sp. ANG-Vp TaxID=1577896 RepID=UPI00057C81A7